jgi:metal-responsive CopG/Arc/MetJ family transcriptional regulator
MKRTKIALPTSLVEALSKYIENTEFNSVEDYITHILRREISAKKESEEVYSQEEEERIKEKLKALGYLE